MKKLFILVLLTSMIQVSSNAQYFKGSFSLETNDTIAFKIQANNGTITSDLSYMEFCIRYLTAQAPTLTTSVPINNTSVFGSALTIDTFSAPYTDGNYTYIRFVHNRGIIASRAYNNNSEYEVFKVKLSQTPTSAMGIELISDLTTINRVFGVVSGSATFFNPTTNEALYGAGYTIQGSTHTVPLIVAPLATKFIHFSATASNHNGLLNWTVANENNHVIQYEVERSTNNGLDFSKIVTVTAKNNGNSINSYNSTDFNIKSLRTTGKIYYRIKEIDDNGTFTYSESRTIKSDITLAVFPNPTKQKTTITYELNSPQLIQVYIKDAVGKSVANYTFQGQVGMNTASIDFNKYARGNYLIIVQTNEATKTFSLIKQ